MEATGLLVQVSLGKRHLSRALDNRRGRPGGWLRSEPRKQHAQRPWGSRAHNSLRSGKEVSQSSWSGASKGQARSAR